MFNFKSFLRPYAYIPLIYAEFLHITSLLYLNLQNLTRKEAVKISSLN